MRASNATIQLIKDFEAFRAKPYLCDAGRPTIGYGHTGGVTLKDPAITMKQAEELLAADLAYYEKGVHDAVRVPLQQYEFDALVSLIFNIGVEAFRTSTLLRHLNAGDRAAAALQFPAWNKRTVAGKLVVTAGLVARRAVEKRLFEGRSGK